MSMRKRNQHTKSESKKLAEQDDGPSSCATTSGHDSGAKTLIEYDVDVKVDIKEEMIQDQEIHPNIEQKFLIESIQLDEKCINTEISSDNNSGAETLIEYDNDVTLNIKQEIIQDQEIHHRVEHKFFSERTQLDEKCLNTEISSDSNSGVKTLIENDNDEILNIKKEIVQAQGAAGQKCTKKYELNLSTANRKDADNIAVTKKLRNRKKQKIQESRHKTNKKGSSSKDIASRHLQASETRHYCDKCSRSYTLLKNLNSHKRVKHAAVEPQFTCDFCGHKTSRKSDLSEHITSRHLQTLETRHYCDKCSRSYTQLSSLNFHKRVEHAAVKPQFTCDICRYKANRKSKLSEHILSRHFQTSTRHYCDKCYRSYIQFSSLRKHKRLVHAAVKPQFTCDFCGYKTNVKGSLSRHITSRHLQTPKRRHYCDKCSRSYTLLNNLNHHKRLKHAAVKPQFTCNFCGYKTSAKSSFSKHISFHQLKLRNPKEAENLRINT